MSTTQLAPGERETKRSDAPVDATLPWWDRWFEVTKRGSSLGTEIRGGLLIFFSMAYIIVLNPLIIGTSKDGTGAFIGGVDSPAQAIPMVAAATCFVAGLLTIFMGAYGRFPIALAAGLGLNAFVAFTLAPQMSWAGAMGLVVLEGLLILLLVLAGFRKAVFHAVPDQLKHAIGVGIGLFLAIIGLVNAGIVRPGSPIMQLGVNGELAGWPMLVFCLAFIVTAALYVRGVKGSILIGLGLATGLALVVETVLNIGPRIGADGAVANDTGWMLTVPTLPSSFVSNPDLGLLGHFSLTNAADTIGLLAAGLAVFSLMLSDFFDTMGTVYALGTEADLVDEDGSVPHLQEIMVVDSVAAIAGGAGSVSSNTAYVESAAGVADGARTGIASIVVGALFLGSMWLSPLVQMVPAEAASAALVLVGFLMVGQVASIDFRDPTIGIPAFLTITIMPFTYSITNGIGVGILSFVLLKVLTGGRKEISFLMYGLAAAFLVYFSMAPIRALFLA